MDRVIMLDKIIRSICIVAVFISAFLSITYIYYDYVATSLFHFISMIIYALYSYLFRYFEIRDREEETKNEVC